MARPLRIEVPGALYHVTTRGNEQTDVFLDDDDRSLFLTLLAACVKRCGWIISAYVLMSNHYHLLIELTLPELSRGLHWLNGTYTAAFNRRHDRVGHVFQGRPHTPIIEKDDYFLNVLRYVVLNPVRAGMVTSPDEYTWSSYRSTAGILPVPNWLKVDEALTYFSPDLEISRKMYRDFVYAGIGNPGTPWDDLVGQIYLGKGPWLERIRDLVEGAPRDYEHPRPQRYIGKPVMREVLTAVAETLSIDEERVRTSRGGLPRMLVAWLGCYEGQHTLSTIAAALRLRSASHVSRLIHRCEKELGHDSALRDARDQCVVNLRRVGTMREG